MLPVAAAGVDRCGGRKIAKTKRKMAPLFRAAPLISNFRTA
jgi:hypothetical protein